MTLIKINIENKDKIQQKSEILNKLNKIQTLVDNDRNYNELVYNIVTNATLHKKNIKVNLDNYGNYKVIDSKNKILGGGLFNSIIGTNAPVQNQQVPKSINNKKTLTKPEGINKVPTVNKLTSQSPAEGVSINNKKNKLTNSGQKEIEHDEGEGHDEGTEQDEGEGHAEGTEHDEGSTAPAQEAPAKGVLINKKNKLTNSGQKEIEHDEGEGHDEGTEHDEGSTAPAPAAPEEPAAQAVPAKPSFWNSFYPFKGDKKDQDSLENKSTSSDKIASPESKGFFSFGGNKDQYSSDEESTSFNKYQTMMFNQDDNDDNLMQHMKNMTNKKYLNTLTTQELKDIMKSNQMRVTNNGSYYNKKEMVSKIYNFYK